MNSWREGLVNARSAKDRDRRFIAASAVNAIGAVGLFRLYLLAAKTPKAFGKVPTQA